MLVSKILGLGSYRVLQGSREHTLAGRLFFFNFLLLRIRMLRSSQKDIISLLILNLP